MIKSEHEFKWEIIRRILEPMSEYYKFEREFYFLVTLIV